jgi:hypothetical protein
MNDVTDESRIDPVIGTAVLNGVAVQVAAAPVAVSPAAAT